MDRNQRQTGTINIGVVYHDGKSGEEGVVLLTDRKVSLGSYGRELPDSFKLTPIAPNVSITVAGSIADAQEVVRKLQSAVIDGEELYLEAVEFFRQEPVLMADELAIIRGEIHSEGIASGDATRYETLRKRLDRTASTRTAYAIKKKLSELEERDSGKVNQKARELLEDKKLTAAEFFEPEEFTLDIAGDPHMNDDKYVRRVRPVRKEGWSGTKIFPNANSVVFQRVDGEISPTVDGLANFFAHTYQERLKEAGYEGLVGGVNPIDGAKLYELEGAGGFVEAKTWAAEGSGSVHITALMDKEAQKLMKTKGYLSREDALALALTGAIPVATGMDNYVAPPLDVVLIKKDGDTGRIASYKIMVDLSKDSKTVIMPKTLSMDALTREEGESTYYKATIGTKRVTLRRMPNAGHFGDLVKVDNPELAGDLKDVSGSYLKIMKTYASK